MKASVQGFEFCLEAETAAEGYDLAKAVADAGAVGMDVAADRLDNYVRIRIAAKVKPGPKKKQPQPPDAEEYARQKSIDAADAVERILAGEKPQ